MLSTHQEFGSRVNIINPVSTHYHSTHVGGTIAAAGIVSSAEGMAPSAFIDSYDWNSETEMAVRGASEPGEPGKIYLSNHSYGHVAGWIWINWSGTYGWHWSQYAAWDNEDSFESFFGQYDSTAATNDTIAYNAPYYLIFKSSGNDRDDNPSTGNKIYVSVH